ncbi:DNA-binding protein [Corynebacterium heidelbergense]|nr:DNA-binding protein [Corynebacterium heidelbergense]
MNTRNPHAPEPHEQSAPPSSTGSRSRTAPRILTLAEPTAGLPAGETVITIAEAADRAGLVASKIFDELNAGRLLDIRVDSVRYIPERFFTEDGEINRFVPGVLALLSDGGYSHRESLEYLFTPDDSLPGRPVDALHGHLAREVMRRTQAMAIS